MSINIENLEVQSDVEEMGYSAAQITQVNA